VKFSDGSTHSAALFRGAEGTGTGTSTTLGGGENVVRSPASAPPEISVEGVPLMSVPELPAHFKVATVEQADQTIRVDGPVGATVRLLALEATLFEPSSGGNDVDPFEANSVTAVSEQTATITSPGGVTFDVTLSPTDASSHPAATATYNYLVATVEDPTDGMTGYLSDVVVLAYDDPGTNQPPVLALIGDQSHVEGDAPDLTVSAVDPDPGQSLTFSATGLPTGLDIEPTSGLIYGTIAAG